MSNIFLAPRSNETAYKNYVSSMQGIPIDSLDPYLDNSDRQILRNVTTVHAWGCQPSIENRWAAMEYGDYILFYARGRFISVGELIFKKKSTELALRLWPRSKATNEPWTCVFFVDNLFQIDLSLEEFNGLTDYDLQAVMGFMPVRKGLEKLSKRFGSVEGFVESMKSGLELSDIDELASISNSGLSEERSLEDIAKFDELTRGKDEAKIEEALRKHAEAAEGSVPEKISKTVKAYKRNRQLVQAIKSKYNNKCQICGFTFKMANGSYYSEAAHIIPISSGKKGVDTPDNIWVLCANHHKMLDTHAIDSASSSSYIEHGVAHELLIK